MFPRLDDETVAELYPARLSLRLVQVIHRHGERTPIRRRLESLISPSWRFCGSGAHVHSAVLQLLNEPKSINELHSGAHPAHESLPAPSLTGGSRANYRRVLERVPEKGDDKKVITQIESGGCYFGQLTDIGRLSLSRLGSNLRALYVDRLGLLPPVLNESDARAHRALYLRSTDYARSFESLQQLVTSGMYPPNKRDPSYIFDIHTRTSEEDNMFADSQCKRLRELIRQFKVSVVKEMEPNLNSLRQRLKDTIPNLSFEEEPTVWDAFDTFTSAVAHDIPLPENVTDRELSDLELIVTRQWFSGLTKSREMSRLWIGRMVAEIANRMRLEADGESNGLRMAIYSGHDSTIGPLLAALGVFNHRWPPFSSTIVLELFEQNKGPEADPAVLTQPLAVQRPQGLPQRIQKDKIVKNCEDKVESAMVDAPLERDGDGKDLVGSKEYERFFVRVRHDERIVALPGCAAQGDHLPGDLSMCTLKAFLEVADEVTPEHFERECQGVTAHHE